MRQSSAALLKYSQLITVYLWRCPEATGSVGKHYIGPVGRQAGSLSASFPKNCPPSGLVGVRTLPRGSVGVRTPPHGSVRVRTLRRGSVRVRTCLVGQIRSGVRVSASFQKNACLVGQFGSGPHLVGRLGLGVRVSACFQKNARLVGQLGLGPHFVADRANVVPANRVDWPCQCSIYPCRATDVYGRYCFVKLLNSQDSHIHEIVPKVTYNV